MKTVIPAIIFGALCALLAACERESENERTARKQHEGRVEWLREPHANPDDSGSMSGIGNH